MTIKVHSENLILINNLTKTSDRLATAMGRLSTGYRINSASDGAAELMLSKGLEKQISGLSVCNDNANMAKSLLTVADGSLSEITSMAQRIRDIALSSANGIYSEDERRAYQTEVDALVSEIKRQTDEARYNDYKLFNNAKSPTIKTGAGTTGSTGAHSVKKISQAQAEAQGYTCVTTAQELKDALVAGDSSCKVMLMADINLDDLGLDATGSNWSAVGDATTRFQGTLDGNGYTIHNLKINATSDYQGLIGDAATSSTIKNLKINNANIENTGTYTGILTGANSGTIENCSITNSDIKSEGERTGGLVGQNLGKVDSCKIEANVKGKANTGGLVGINSNLIISCIVTGSVVGSETNTGGFVGQNNTSGSYNGKIENCYSRADVTGTTITGGFVGESKGNSTIISSYATGNITGSNDYTGGFAGFIRNRGSITSCYAKGDARGNGDGVGGFIGRIENLGTINSCYAKGNVSGNGESTGGFVGTSAEDSTILKSYSTGNVTNNGIYTGGFVGLAYNNTSITSCYSTGDTESSGNYTGGFAGRIYLNSSSVVSCYSTGSAVGKNYTGGFAGSIEQGLISNSYSTGNATGTTGSTGDFLGQASTQAILDNYSFDGALSNGIGTGTNNAIGADDTAGKNTDWFKEKNNLINILGDGWDYSNSDLTFQVGTNAGLNHTLSIDLNFGVDDFEIDVMSQDSARDSLSAIDELIEYVTQMQGKIGSATNVMDSVLGNNTQTQINLVDSNARLIDADIARESAEVVKTQIRQNMTASLLAQTGTNMSQIVLALYGL
ncbi:hypothetical protein IKA15_03540 [bacterium]|nr:hypothetical protein [bacterium]